ncbi:MAG: methionyl-tRNA formyltransferase [Ruminococcaceae bacterium]|nr:methionyl-tRNA formyltransferase [Oscillospiraceae bacterium]
MKIVFMGTPDFSVPCLRALVEKGYEVALVVTQADKPKGRGHKLTPPPVKKYALTQGIPVYQPEKMKDNSTYEYLKCIGADLYIVVAYGKILPEAILQLPKYGCINVHASLLPKLRGAAPIQWSIINGEAVTGVTTMQMDVGLDTGDMLLKKEIPIEERDTGETLHDKLTVLGKEVLLETLEALEEGMLNPQKQDDSLSNYAPMIDKTVSKIDFSKDCLSICRLIRAMNSYPFAHTFYEGKLLKIIQATPVKGNDFTGENGEILAVDADGILIKCDNGAICATEIQMEGKRKMLTSEYVKGNSFTIGTILE